MSESKDAPQARHQTPVSTEVAADWNAIMPFSQLGIRTIAANTVLEFRIIPCLINGIQCGTAFFRAADWKLNWLKGTREVVENSNMNDDDKRTRLKALDNEKDDVLGNDLKKSWDTLKANLDRRLETAKASLHDTTTADGTKSANDAIHEIERLINDLVNEGRPK